MRSLNCVVCVSPARQPLDGTHLKVDPQPAGTEDAVEDEVRVFHPLVPYQTPPCSALSPDTYSNPAPNTQKQKCCEVPAESTPLEREGIQSGLTC